MSRLAIYPGSFDPLTNGHVSLIQRGLKIFDGLVVAVANNPAKKPLFTLEERREMILEAVGGDSRVEVDSFDTLLVDYAKRRRIHTVLRGLRAVSDFEYEFQIANMNRHLHPDLETVQAIGDSLPQSARDGAFPTVREALRRLDELSADPALMGAISEARETLSDRRVLAEVCSAVATDADAAIAGEIMHAGGPAGAEALLDAYVRGSEEQRSLLRPVLRSMSDGVLGVARSRLRTDDAHRAVAILHTLAVLGDKRAIPVITQALSHLDEQVRFAAISALADTPEPEAANSLVKALGHPQRETQRYAIREIGRVKAAPAVHQLTRALEDLNVLQRTYETKREVIMALEQIGTPEAERALKRTAGRPLVFGRKGRELRALARRALENIRQAE